MRYRLRHTTRYDYGTPVDLAAHMVHLRPRPIPGQRILSDRVLADPPPARRRDGVDHFGNRVTWLFIDLSHETFELTSESIVDVAEVVPEIVQWNRELFGHCAGHPLKDPRTRLHMGDVNSRIAAVNGLYDVMLLDVDNGPDGLVRGDNDRIYSRRGLDRAWTAMRPGSVLAVWSSRSDDRFADRLTRGGFTVTEHRVRARRTKGPVRTIWIAWRR